MWEQWGVKFLAFPLTWHIAYTTACCYRTSRDLSKFYISVNLKFKKVNHHKQMLEYNKYV